MTCSEGCGNKVKARGLCNGHYRQWHAGRPLTPLRRHRLPAEVRPAPGMQHCPECDQVKPESEFSRSNRGPCKPCHARNQQLRVSGLTKEQYLAATSAACSICGSDGPIVLDHDHRCCPPGRATCGRCFRGPLCHKCNLALGFVGDDLTWLAKAIAYLSDHLTPTTEETPA